MYPFRAFASPDSLSSFLQLFLRRTIVKSRLSQEIYRALASELSRGLSKCPICDLLNQNLQEQGQEFACLISAPGGSCAPLVAYVCVGG